MCSPQLALAAVTVAAGYQQNRSLRAQGSASRDVAQFNARQQEIEAARTREAGVEAENEQRRRAAELLSRQRAQLAATGVDIESGSPLLLQEDTETLGEADALRIRRNFQTRADSLEQGAEVTRAQGEARRSSLVSQGRGAFQQSLLAAGASFIGSGVADKWFTPNSAATLAGNQSADAAFRYVGGGRVPPVITGL